MTKVALLGCGRAGRIHIQAWIDQRTDMELICICDPDVKNAEELARMMEDAGWLRPAVHSDPRQVLKDPRVEAVILCTPTSTHEALVSQALGHNKHVLCEKPLVQAGPNALERMEALYGTAAKHRRVLMTAYNRRYDPEWSRFRSEIAKDGGVPFALQIVCRDHPVPSDEYLSSCGSMFRDCGCHDLDMVLVTLRDHPVKVDATSGYQDTMTRISLQMSRGTMVTLIHSRYAPYYDQRAEAFLSDGQHVSLLNPRDEPGIQFQERYRASYAAQLGEFCTMIEQANRFKEAILFPPLSNALALERVLQACEEASQSQP